MPKHNQDTYDMVATNLAIVERHIEPWVHELLTSLFNVDFYFSGEDYDEKAFKEACHVVPESITKFYQERV